MRRALVLAATMFAACGAAPEPVPGIDLGPQFEQLGLHPRAQGGRPTCSIFTTVAVFEFAFARATGTPMRFSADYCNWAANAATGRGDDGDFFHCALAGVERFGLCRDELWPYGAAFDAAAAPSPDALVDAGGHRSTIAARLRVRWIRPNDGQPGLTGEQFRCVVEALRSGWPVAAGAGHSRVLVGWREDRSAPGGGVFLTLDSGPGRYGEVPAAFVRDDVCDAFVVETVPGG
jgi:hypothetical protein